MDPTTECSSFLSRAAACLSLSIAICLPAVAASGFAPDTLIEGTRCELAEVFWLPPQLYIGSTAQLVVKKILKDGSYADFLPEQRFVVRIADTSGESEFLFPNKVTSSIAFGVTMPVQFKVGRTGGFDLKAWAILPDKKTAEVPSLPLTIPSPELAGKIYQTMGYEKLRLGFFADARSTFDRAIQADSGRREFYYYDIGCTYAREGRDREALDWLRRAVDSGYHNFTHALKLDPDLETLRRHPDFRSAVTAPLARTRSKLRAEIAAKPESASENFFEIARTFLPQGDVDSFYVSVESGLKRGLVPNWDKLSGEEGFSAIENDDRLDSLETKYVSPVLLAKLNGKPSKRHEAPQWPALHPNTLALKPAAAPFESMILLQIGDTVRGKYFYALDWNKKSVNPLGHVSSLEAKRASRIQVNWKGVIAFAAHEADLNERLFVRIGHSTASIDAPFREAYIDGSGVNNSELFPSFALSAENGDIIASANRDLFVVDTASGTVFTQVLVSLLPAGKNQFGAPRLDTVATEGFNADARYDRSLEGWDVHEPDVALFQDVYPGQLTCNVFRLWKYNPRSRTYTLASPDMERYLSSSPDGKYVLFTDNDETCCAGVNYSNNRIVLQNAETHANTVVYDEWGRFGNYGKPEEHEPNKVELSPDGKWVAATIRNFYEPGGHSAGSGTDSENASGEITANVQLFVFGLDGSVRLVVSNREFVGWLDAAHVLLQQSMEKFSDSRWATTSSELRVFDIESGVEHPLLATDAECIGIQWRASKQH